MIDRERVLARLDTLDGYLRELREILPASLESYRRVETRRACERLLQIAIESVIDVCGLLVTGLRLGLPGEEDDLIEKLAQAGVVPSALRDRLRRMKGLRNILVHEYGRIDDRIVYEVVTGGLGDFDAFKDAALAALRKEGR
ncbi:MAG: type VII toxin-antitoxin system HepT family RNase toxin [Candidatus Rokuibacteriota bacterium]